MILVLIMMAVLWFTGRYMAAPVQLRLAMIGVLWAGVVGLHLALPEGHALRLATGGRAEVWLALGVVALLIAGYRYGLRRLRGRVVAPPAMAGAAFRPAELDRYSRHILLREIGGPGQRRLKDSKVLVIGAGGAGVTRAAVSGGIGGGHDRGDRRRPGGKFQPSAAGDSHRCAHRAA